MSRWVAALVVLAATRTGDLDAAAECLRLPVPCAMFESRSGLHYQYARGTDLGFVPPGDKSKPAVPVFVQVGSADF